MKTNARTLAGAGCTALILASSVLAPAAAAETFRESFQVAPGGRLDLDTDVGSVDVRTHSQATVEVTVDVSGRNAEDFHVELDQRGDEVRVRGDYRGRRSWFGSRTPRARFEVTVPERFDLDLDTSGGSISVRDLRGEVRAETSGGGLDFGRIDGSIRGRTSGGSIELDGCTGEVDVSTSGGSIRIGDVEGDVRADTSGGSIEVGRVRGQVDLETSGGSIHVDEAAAAVRAETSGGDVRAYLSGQPRGDSRLRTSGGGITVYLAPGVGVDVHARSGGGKVRSDFDLDFDRDRTSASGPVQGGGPDLVLRTSGGGVTIRKK